MSTPIVQVNVSQIVAPEPDKLQKTGALISQGGTNLTVGVKRLLTQLSDLTTLLATPLALTSLAWASSFGGTVTATATVNHGIAAGQQFTVTIAGAVPTGYNGTYLAMATGAATFTYSLAVDPGSETAPGTYSAGNSAELVAMATTFFTQGANQSVYVLELGLGAATVGISNLTTFLAGTDQFFYSYLTPRSWDGVAEFLTLAANYTAPESKTYFYTTSSVQNRTRYADTLKSVELLVEPPNVGVWAANVISGATYSTGRITYSSTTPHGVAPGQYFTISGFTPDTYNGTFLALNGTTGSTLIAGVAADPGSDTIQGTLVASLYASSPPPASTFDHASDFWVSLNYDPSSTNKVTPFAFNYLYGVTQFPTQGNSALIASMKADYNNYVGTGAEGGISNTMLLWGTLLDGRPLNYWYAIDWVQITGKQAVAAAIINGSNDPTNPLYYNQDGINRLQQVLAGVGGTGITVGLALGKVIITSLDGPSFDTALDSGIYAGNVVINAVPFTAYTAANPTHYRQGIYNGLSFTFTPLRGFESITINIVATDFVSA